MRLGALAVACATGLGFGLVCASTGAAQQRPSGSSTSRIIPAPPSRADSMLAVGRLAVAEDALYAAVTARPRSSAARGALGRYLASRGRFVIAETLYLEALRFGAETTTVRRAIAAMAPYRASPSNEDGVVRVPFRVGDDGVSLGRLTVRTPDGDRTAVVDPQVTGVVARTAVREYWIGARRFVPTVVSIDTTVATGELRIGLDQLWALHPAVDERRGELTLGAAPPTTGDGARTQQIPFVLTFPGLELVPRPGVAPVAIEGRAGRALLRGTRWQVNSAFATVTVER